MPLNLLQRIHRDQKGTAGLEMVLVLPLYGLLIYSVFTLGDMVYQAEKLQVAANYAASKQDVVDSATIKSMFLEGAGKRVVITSVTDPEGTKNSYPYLQTPNTLMLRYRSLQKDGIAGVTPSSDQGTVRKILGKAFEGSIGSFSPITPPYFSLLTREGGGWVSQRKAAVNITYHQMFPFKNIWSMHAFVVTLAGTMTKPNSDPPEYGSKMVQNDVEVWDFRDERQWNRYRQYNPITFLAWKKYPNSGWNAALFKELSPPLNTFVPEEIKLIPDFELKLPWAELPFGDYDGAPAGAHKVE